jgi:hypothetical protein
MAAAAEVAQMARAQWLREHRARVRVDPAARCVELAHAGGATRRALAEAAERFVSLRGWERLGFARLCDYAVERLGLSARELQDLARVDFALASLPRVSEALAGGRISWTKARLLARVARREDEARWLGIAKALSARALAREVRRMDVGSLGIDVGSLGMDLRSLEAGGHTGAGGGAEKRGETFVLRCTPTAKAKWHRARLLANRVAGQALAPWQCAENVAAEVLSSVPLDGGVPGADAGGPEIAAVAPDRTDGARSLPRAERRSRVAPAEDRSNDGLDAFGLDARLRELVDREQRAEAELAGALLGVAEGRLHRGLGFSTLDDYAQDALGISPRKARMILRLARAARRVPTLGAAWRSGSLSFLRAYGLVPVALAAPEHAVRWVERARRVPCIRLEEEVSAAVVLAELDPAGFAATGGVPAASPAPDT